MDAKDYIDELTEEEFELFEEAKAKAKPLLKLNEDAYTFVQGREENLVENLAFYEGTQYQLERYQEPKPWVVRMKTPYSSVAIDTRVASLISSDYQGNLVPLNPESVEAVGILNEILNERWGDMGIDNLITDAIKTGAVLREGYIHTMATKDSKGNKVIKCEKIDPSVIRLDPNAREWSEVSYIAVPSRLPVQEALVLYPKYEKYFLELKSTKVSPQERGEVSLSNDYSTNQDKFFTKLIMYRKELKSEGSYKIIKDTIIEDILVDEKELTGLSRIPISQFRWKKQKQSCYGLSMMDDLISLQMAINSIESAITNTAVSYASPMMAVRDGSGLNPASVAKVAGAPGVVLKVKGNIQESVQTILPPKIDDAIVGIKNDYENSIEKIAGISKQYLGAIGTSGNTAEGSRMSIERARIIEADVIRNIREFVEEQTYIVCEYLLALYGGEIITSRIKDDMGKFSFVQRNVPSSITSDDFSFSIDMTTKTQFSKEEEKQKYLELYQIERQYDAPVKVINVLDIIKQFDFKDYDDLKQRYERIEGNSAEQRSNLIVAILEQATKLGISQDLLKPAIMEIIENKSDTPQLDALVQDMQTMVQEQAQMQTQAVQQGAEQGVPPQEVQNQMALDSLAQNGTPNQQVLANMPM